MAGPLINFSGLASGIDSASLIEATSEAARITKVIPHETKISELEDTNTALDDVKTMLDELKDIIFEFSTLGGGIVEKSADSSNEAVITATANNSATNGTYELTVNTLAENATFSFDDSISDPDAKITSAGGGPFTVTFTIGTTPPDPGETVSFNVTDDDTTYAGYVALFNENSSLATASMINVGTTSLPDYRIVIVSNEVGTEKGTITLTNDGNITGDPLADTAYSVDQAQNASFNIAGISTAFTRSSNTITDVIQGVTFNLEDTGASITVKVGDDVASTTANAQSFIDKYNEIVTYLSENNLIIPEQNGDSFINIFGPLASTRVDDSILSAIRSGMVGASYSSGTEVKIFADMGITTARDGTLSLNGNTWTGAPTFEDAVSSESESVRQIFLKFADTVSTTGGTIDQYTRFNGLIDSTITGNDTLIDDLNDRIARAEASISAQEDMLRARFARLESSISKMQSQQSALTSALAGLSAS
ncbi:flagellar filament capping protein FliD [Oligoflexia bacterium]|nr:flagellar filament capping protein FliD [Oligoflexia bacterium]